MDDSSHSHPKDTPSCEPCPPAHTVHLPLTEVDTVAEYQCSLQGNYIGSQKRACVLGETDGVWQKASGFCMSVGTIALLIVIVIIVIAVVVLILVRKGKKSKAVGGVKGKKTVKGVPKTEKKSKNVKV